MRIVGHDRAKVVSRDVRDQVLLRSPKSSPIVCDPMDCERERSRSAQGASAASRTRLDESQRAIIVERFDHTGVRERRDASDSPGRESLIDIEATTTGCSPALGEKARALLRGPHGLTRVHEVP